MKGNKLFAVIFSSVFLASCGGPDLLVINHVHKDGSVTRKVIMTYDKDEFDLADSQVPVDSTWLIEKSFTVSDEMDTIFTLTAEKHFESVAEINLDYKEFEGANKLMTRFAEFEKRFRWFTTTYYYSEIIRGAIDGYAPEEFFNDEEINLFYMPDEILDTHLNSPDSLKYKAIVDSKEEKYDEWLGRSLTRAVILELIEISNDTIPDLESEFLFSREIQLADSLMAGDGDEFVEINQVFGDGYYERNQAAIDSALAHLEDDFNVSFETDQYLVQTNMPGELIATNGYIDTNGNIVWMVNGDVILSRDYVMWAESGIINRWAWIVSGLFLLFVITGFIIKFRRGK